ncbi:MAG TPA: hypothetical protein PKX38_09565 [Alphaproteobacteria bacterium]|nr:hypothetical protein [Alphaproteobacteria bacterium]
MFSIFNNKKVKAKSLREAADMIEIIRLAATGQGQEEILRSTAVQLEDIERREVELRKSHKQSVDDFVKREADVFAREAKAGALESANASESQRINTKEQDILDLDKRVKQRDSEATAKEQQLIKDIAAYQKDRDALDETIKGHKDRADAAIFSAEQARKESLVSKENYDTLIANINKAASGKR